MEERFRTAFFEHLTSSGCQMRQGSRKNARSIHVTMPGPSFRQWTLSPQVQVHGTIPDFLLETNDSAIPSMAIYTDGKAFHASAKINRLADDSIKRAKLRANGYIVWAVTWRDIDRADLQDPDVPQWFEVKLAQTLAREFELAPTMAEIMKFDAFTQILRWMDNPDLSVWSNLGRSIPFFLLRPGGVAASSLDQCIVSAVAALDQAPTFQSPGEDTCWSYSDGAISMAAGTTRRTTRSGASSVVLAIDDRDSSVGTQSGDRAWHQWLAMSNLLGLCRSPEPMITTYALLSALISGEMRTILDTTLEDAISGAWKAIFDQAVADEERRLIIGLALAGEEVPELGHETASGLLVDIAWPEQRVGVVWPSANRDEERDLLAAGWHLAEPEVSAIIAALKSETRV